MQITSLHDTFSYEGIWQCLFCEYRKTNCIKKDAETRRKRAKIRCYSLKVIFITARGLPKMVFSEARLIALSYYSCRLCFLCNSRFHINEESGGIGNTMQVRHYVITVRHALVTHVCPSELFWLSPRRDPVALWNDHQGAAHVL